MDRRRTISGDSPAMIVTALREYRRPHVGMPWRRDQAGEDVLPCSASAFWYAFHPGHQPVCHFHIFARIVSGFRSAYFRHEQFSQRCWESFSTIGSLLFSSVPLKNRKCLTHSAITESSLRSILEKRCCIPVCLK